MEAADLELIDVYTLRYLDWQREWAEAARPNQLLPDDESWSECGLMAGRGFGKTRAGAEWLAKSAYEDPSGFDSAIIAPTQSDVRFTCIEGESGLLSVIPPDLVVHYNSTDKIITMRNIAGGTSNLRGFSAERPERLRGPQHCRGWLDELAAWLRADETWDMYMFGLRLGKHPQTLWTTTPRPRSLIRKLTKPQANRIIVRGTTYDNRANLPERFFENVAQYEGTKIGRQELHGELIDPEEAGIVKRSHFQLWPAKTPLPYFDWIIMSLDTAFTQATIDKKTFDPDPTACGVWGVFTLKGKSYMMLLDSWDELLGMPELIKRVKKELKVAYGQDEDIALVQPKVGGIKPITSGRKPDICVIEDKGSGISLRQMLDAEGITTYPYNPGNADKLARLHMVSHIFVQRRVFLPESLKTPDTPRTWCEPLVAQLCSFLGEGSIAHDDHVDATTQAIRLCIDKGLLTPAHIETDELRRKLHPELAEDEVKPPRKPALNPYAQ